MSGWYDRIVGTPQLAQPQYSGMNFQNPIQKMNYILEAMKNPAAFVSQAIPGLPASIANDPNQILAYMKQNCGVTDYDIQRVASQIPKGW